MLQILLTHSSVYELSFHKPGWSGCIYRSSALSSLLERSDAQPQLRPQTSTWAMDINFRSEALCCSQSTVWAPDEHKSNGQQLQMWVSLLFLIHSRARSECKLPAPTAFGALFWPLPGLMELSTFLYGLHWNPCSFHGAHGPRLESLAQGIRPNDSEMPQGIGPCSSSVGCHFVRFLKDGTEMGLNKVN